VREVDRLAVVEDWDAVIGLREACLAATEETGRQLWGPARYAAYRTALDAPAPDAAAMLEPGVVRFGLGPLTEVVAQRHTFAELAPHLDGSVLPVVAQERVLRGEDLRDDERAAGAPDDPPLVLQPFEPHYVLPEYRADERLDGAVPDPAAATSALARIASPRAAPHAEAAADAAPDVAASMLARALTEVVAPWAERSSGELRVTTVAGDADAALGALIDELEASGGPLGDVVRGPVTIAELFAMLAHAGASGGVHGRRRGGAAGRSLAWWVARCATGLDREDVVDAEELEFRLEDLERIAFRLPGEAAWRLELAIGARGARGPGEWSVAVAAFDRSEDQPEDPEGPGSGSDTAPW